MDGGKVQVVLCYRLNLDGGHLAVFVNHRLRLVLFVVEGDGAVALVVLPVGGVGQIGVPVAGKACAALHILVPPALPGFSGGQVIVRLSVIAIVQPVILNQEGGVVGLAGAHGGVCNQLQVAAIRVAHIDGGADFAGAGGFAGVVQPVLVEADGADVVIGAGRHGKFCKPRQSFAQGVNRPLVLGNVGGEHRQHHKFHIFRGDFLPVSTHGGAGKVVHIPVKQQAGVVLGGLLPPGQEGAENQADGV